MVGRQSGAILVADLEILRHHRAPRDGRWSGARRCRSGQPGAAGSGKGTALVPRCESQFRRESSALHGRRARTFVVERRGTPAHDQLSRAPRSGRNAGSGARCSGSQTGRQGGRLATEHSRSGNRDVGGDIPGRNLVFVLARLRRAGSDGSLRSDRAEDPVRRRWILVQRQGDRSAAAAATDRVSHSRAGARRRHSLSEANARPGRRAEGNAVVAVHRRPVGARRQQEHATRGLPGDFARRLSENSAGWHAHPRPARHLHARSWDAQRWRASG